MVAMAPTKLAAGCSPEATQGLQVLLGNATRIF